MNIRTAIFLLSLTLIGCKEAPKDTDDMHKATEEEMMIEEAIYPPELQKVFDTHGGLAVWKQQRILKYDIPKKSGTESHTIDLYTRKDLVETENFKMGYDGTDVWLLDPGGNYKGDPVFYHNLMFYFYAMPFVLADNGIRYFGTDPLIYEGKEYPGVGIGYQNGVGTSPEDEYFIHYDPNTFQMAWLGYTVTYKTGEKSDDIHWIRYDNWTNIEGVVLPKSISWHLVEEAKVGELRNTVTFENIQLSKDAVNEAAFSMPEGAEVRLPLQTVN